jgi:thioredoxin 1
MSTDDVVEIDGVDDWTTNVEKSSDPVLVMFYSPSCPHCQVMEPYFQSYATEYKGKIKFVKVNVLDEQIVAAKYGVLGTPTFKLFCKGHPIQDYVGEMYPSLIKKMIEDGLENNVQCVTKVTWVYPGITGYS